MVSDPIADLLTRIRNAQERQHDDITLPSSKMLTSVAEILKQEGFIEDYSVLENDVQDDLNIKLKYVNGVPAIRELVRVSKPGIRKYLGYRSIRPVKNGLGVAIFSTPVGVISGEEARKQKIGGEFICYVS